MPAVALYEHHNRLDEPENGVRKTRAAVFTADSITWTNAVWRLTVDRIAGTLRATGNIPEIASSVFSGTCSRASERKF